MEAITILSGQIEKLRRAEIPGLRMVRPEGVHLTLKFLGEISQEKILSIQRILEQLAEKTPAFSLQLSQAGVFPSTNPALVLWIGVAGDLTALQGLQMSIDSFLDPIGFASTNSHKTFQPHLTVARFNQRPKKMDRHRCADLHLSSWDPPDISFTVDLISLMRSHLQIGGARYQTVAEVSLNG